MKWSGFNNRKIWYRLFSKGILTMVVLSFIQCFTIEEVCGPFGIDRDGRASFFEILISSPVSIIEIDVHSGETYTIDCIDVCSMVELRYILYSRPIGSANEEIIIDQGRVKLGEEDFVDHYLGNLKFNNVPQSSNLRLVLEANTPSCGVGNIQQIFEHKFVSPTYTDGTPPNNLIYNPNSIVYIDGDEPTINSPLPTIDPENGPYTYIITDVLVDGKPSRNETVGSSIHPDTGVITFPAQSPFRIGTYSYEIAVTNSAGTTIFQNAFTFIKTDEEGRTPPSNLEYSPNNIVMDGSAPIASTVPTLAGTGPFTFSFENPILPDTAISINSETGVITAHRLLAAEYGNGTYTLNVTVENAVGKRTFPAALTVTVDTSGGPIPSNLVYDPYLVLQTSAISVSSSVPTLSGTPPFTFALVNSNLPNSTISIDPNTGVITATEELFIQEGPGFYPQNVMVTNASGRETFNNVFRINVVRDVATSLAYEPNTITQTSTAPVSSVAPIVTGGVGPYVFSITNNVPGIIIDPNTGVITATETLALVYGNGSYTVNVGVANSSGLSAFVNAFTVVVSNVGGELPSDLVYSPNTITQGSAVTVASPIPTVLGSTPLTFSIENSNVPSSSTALSINAFTGVITATSELFSEIGQGTYTIDVGATNAAGSVTFPAAFTIEVPLVTIVYNPNAISINTVTAITSPTPTVTGIPGTLTYSIANIDALNVPITIDPNTGVISATEILVQEFGNNTYNIHVSVTNGAGTTYTQNNAYTIIVAR